MEEETGSNSSVAEPEAEVESVSTETPAIAKDSSTKETEAQDEGGTDTVAVLEKRFKDTQAELTRSRQELADLKRQHDLDGAQDLKAKIGDLEKRLEDPDYLASKYEALKRRQEEDENLTPEQKEIRAMRREFQEQRVERQREKAYGAYRDLMDVDPFFEKYQSEVAKFIANDPEIRDLILRNPEKGYKAVKGHLIDDVHALEKDGLRKELEAEEAQKIADAKRKKTSMSASSSSKGTSASTNVASGSRSVGDLYDEWYRNNPSGDKK